MEPNQDRRRGHFHRARRGHDRRGGPDRRPQAPPAQPPQGPARDQVNVEHIMRDIRTRVAARSGVDLSYEQIQDLAARRLESILDPRSIKPSLIEGLKRGAGAAPASPGPKMSSEPVYTFEDTTIYDSHRAILRWFRKLLNPLLKLFFNPNPLIRAMHLQAGINTEAAARDAERDRMQAEWNALHYEILQRLVTEVSRVTLELQAITNRVEALDARIEFADRRVRALEGAQSQVQTRVSVRESPPSGGTTQPEASSPGEVSQEGGATDGTRRRRRRRRGRRSGFPPGDPRAGVQGGAADPQGHVPGAPLEQQGGHDIGDDGPDDVQDEASDDAPEHLLVEPAATIEAVTAPEPPAYPTPEPVQTSWSATPEPDVRDPEPLGRPARTDGHEDGGDPNGQ